MIAHVFLGGTVGTNTWRDEVIPELMRRGIPAEVLYEPPVDDWTEEIQAREDAAKRQASYQLYVIARPGGSSDAVSAYSLVEAVMGLYDRPGQTVVAFDTSGMTGHALKAMRKIIRDLQDRFPDAPIFDNNRGAAIDWLVSHYHEQSAFTTRT
jgi:hypothetical protein